MFVKQDENTAELLQQIRALVTRSMKKIDTIVTKQLQKKARRMCRKDIGPGKQCKTKATTRVPGALAVCAKRTRNALEGLATESLAGETGRGAKQTRREGRASSVEHQRNTEQLRTHLMRQTNAQVSGVDAVVGGSPQSAPVVFAVQGKGREIFPGTPEGVRDCPASALSVAKPVATDGLMFVFGCPK